jgi:hypothetical protein
MISIRDLRGRQTDEGVFYEDIFIFGPLAWTSAWSEGQCCLGRARVALACAQTIAPVFSLAFCPLSSHSTVFPVLPTSLPTDKVQLAAVRNALRDPTVEIHFPAIACSAQRPLGEGDLRK